MRQDILHPVIATKPIKIIESLIDRLKDASRNNNSEAPDRKDSDDEDFNVFDDDFKTLNLGLSNVDVRRACVTIAVYRSMPFMMNL